MPKTDKNGVVTYNAESKNDYLDFISEFPTAGSFQPGVCYAFHYAFTKNPKFKKMKLKSKWFYNFEPAANLCLFVRPEKKLACMISLSQLPVPVRRQIIAKLRQSQPSAFGENKKKLKFTQLLQLFRLFKKLKISVRNYSLKRASEVKIVPPEEVDNLIEFTASFLWRGTHSGIVQRYRNYRPK